MVGLPLRRVKLNASFQFRIELNYTGLWGWEVRIHNKGYSEKEYGGQGFLLDLWSMKT